MALEMIHLKKHEDWTYKQIAKKFGVTINCVCYHVNPKHNELMKANARKQYVKKRL